MKKILNIAVKPDGIGKVKRVSEQSRIGPRAAVVFHHGRGQQQAPVHDQNVNVKWRYVNRKRLHIQGEAT